MSFYTGTFAPATDDADWALVMDLTDDTTGLAYDVTELEFSLEITEGGTSQLSASTEAGTITRPSTNEIAWRFTRAQMATLCAGRTYKVGCVAVDGDGNTTQMFVADLPVIDGGMA